MMRGGGFVAKQYLSWPRRPITNVLRYIQKITCAVYNFLKLYFNTAAISINTVEHKGKYTRLFERYMY